MAQYLRTSSRRSGRRDGTGLYGHIFRDAGRQGSGHDRKPDMKAAAARQLREHCRQRRERCRNGLEGDENLRAGHGFHDAFLSVEKSCGFNGTSGGFSGMLDGGLPLAQCSKVACLRFK